MTATNFIPLASPDITDHDISVVSKVLKSGNLVQGREVKELESKLSSYLGVDNCIMMTNGTSTLQLILVALGIGFGDEVIVPAFSYIATANVVELVGAKPVFVDIDIDTFNIDVNLIQSAITSKTRAVMAVHEFGLTADLIELKRICDDHGLFLIEDAACALGAQEKNYHAGSVGIAGSFSFHPRKAITSGEGGAVVTNSSDLAIRLRTLRNHGIYPDVSNGMEFIDAGFNCRMTDFQAALLSSQFNRFDYIMNRKSEIAKRYLNEIVNPKLKLPIVPLGKTPSWQTFHILLDESLGQKETITHLKNMGIGTNYGAQCMPEQQYFKNKYKLDTETLFPNACKAYKKGLAIPLYEKLTDHQVNYIIESLNNL